MKLIQTCLAACMLTMLTTTVLFSAEIKLPGIEISDDTVETGIVKIDKEGVEIQGIVSIKTTSPSDNTSSDSRTKRPEYIKANYSRADFSGMDLAGAIFLDSNFSRAIFNGTNLKGAHIERSNLSRAN